MKTQRIRWSSLKGWVSLFLLCLPVVLGGCSHDKLPLPTIPPVEDRFGNAGEQVYVQINPPLDQAHGYAFNQPADVYVGVDNFLYIADTGNDRIVMLDLGGALQGISQPIPHPEAISQNDSLQLLIVNNTNAVYRIDLVKYNHEIWRAPVEKVYEQASEPTRQFTGISVHNGFDYYVTVIDVADTSTNFKAHSFIYDFFPDNTLKGPLPMHVNGTGLYSAILPNAIVSMRERWLDISSRNEDTPAFWFVQKGFTSVLQNNFPVQHIATRIFEGQEVLDPDVSLIGTDIYDRSLYYNAEDIAIDRSGFVFVVDAGLPVGHPGADTHPPGFYRFAPNGKLLQALTGAGSGERQFNTPRGIAVTPFLEDQVVYISDTGNNRILRFKLSTEL